ncbi:MAG: flap endonuclease [Bryobacterales bacterium]|nr:flap endonuclease [Bryobacterales bacterium]
MKVHLIDGTYELFRHYYAVPPAQDAAGVEIGAVRGVVTSMVALLEKEATHVGVATDHVIESFRNRLYGGYKTGDGMDPVLYAQFPILEQSLEALGVAVWPLVEFEADDGLASAAALAAREPQVDQVLICTPDKDLAQCVVGSRVVLVDRRKKITFDEDGILAKFGVKPRSIPDYLALVGDSADGYPGLTGWGPKSAAAILERYGRLEAIPRDWKSWPSQLRGAQRLCTVLLEQWDHALLYRRLATLAQDAPVSGCVAELRWSGPRPEFAAVCARLGAKGLPERAMNAARGR